MACSPIMDCQHKLIKKYSNLDFFDDTEGLQRSEEHTSELQSLVNLVCRLLLEKKKNKKKKKQKRQKKKKKKKTTN